MNRPKMNQSREERLNTLKEQLKKEQEIVPFGINAKIADLYYKILSHPNQNIVSEEEQIQYIGSMFEYAYYMKTNQRDHYVAQQTFERVLKLDPENQDANYRLGFLFYEAKQWISAITHFERAIQSRDSNFPLEEDQVVKANLFISYCSMMLANDAMKQAEQLSKDEIDTFEGISIDALTSKVKDLLASKHYMLIKNNDTTYISTEAYKALVDHYKENELILDFTTNIPYIQLGQYSSELSLQLAYLLKKFLIANGSSLSLTDIGGYQEESVTGTNDVSWDNYRRMVSRLNRKCRDIGFLDRAIHHIPQTKSYRMIELPFYIVQYDAK